MIRFGLSGWNNHNALYPPMTKDKLLAYCVHFPIVELDSSFYAVQPARNYEKWARVTPDEFAFVIKAYQGMTGHLRGGHPFENTKVMFDAETEEICIIFNNNSGGDAGPNAKELMKLLGVEYEGKVPGQMNLFF